MSQEQEEFILPTRAGKYTARGVWGEWESTRVIDVYEHPLGGLAVFTEDYGGDVFDNDDEYGCHVPPGFTGLKFITRVGDLR